jgi:hypothetical protein
VSFLLLAVAIVLFAIGLYYAYNARKAARRTSTDLMHIARNSVV